MRTRNIVLFLVFIFLFSLVSAQPPVQFSPGTDGLSIIIPQYERVRVNTSFTLNVHVFNYSNNIPLSNISSGTTYCFLDLYNPDGTELYDTQLTYVQGTTPVGEWRTFIDSSNFSRFGLYSYIIQCNNTFRGGYANGLYEVTYSGVMAQNPESIIMIGILFLLLVVIALFVYFGTKIPSNDTKDDLGQVIGINYLKYLRGVIFMVSWVLFVYFLFVTSNIAYFYLQELLLAKAFFTLYIILFRMSIIALPVYFFYLLINLLRDRELNKMLNQGFNP